MIFVYMFAALAVGCILGFLTACILVSQKLNK